MDIFIGKLDYGLNRCMIDNIEKKVKAEVLDSWLLQGWKLGGRKRLAQ